MPTPDYNQKLASEDKVKLLRKKKGHGGCDLALYKEKDSATKGVLVVTVNIQFNFEDGGEQEGGGELVWTDDTKELFMTEYKKAVKAVWENKHTLKGGGTPGEISVIYNLHTQDGWTLTGPSIHWKINVKGVPLNKGMTSVTDMNEGSAKMDGNDIYKAKKANGYQRGCAHEFGHMMHLFDEYQPKSSGNWASNWQDDDASVMHDGEAVRDRHYTPLATWVGSKLGSEYKVNGTMAAADAYLG